MRRSSRIALGSLLTLSTMSWMFAVGCGGGDDDDNNNPGADAGLDSTTPFDAEPGVDATFPDASKDAGGDVTVGDSSTGPEAGPGGGEAGADSSTEAGPGAGDAGDAGHDGGDSGIVDAGADAADADAGPAATAYRLVGRWETSADGKSYTASWPGSGFVVTFTGTTLQVTTIDTPNTATAIANAGLTGSGDYFDGFINGVRLAKPVLVAANGVTTITSTAAATGNNKAEIFKMTDSYVGNVTLVDTTAGNGTGTPFTVANAGAGGAIVPENYTFSHKIEFIGDDQTAGYGDTPDCDGKYGSSAATSQNDETYAYPNLVARSFSAEHITTAEWNMGIDINNYYDTTHVASALWPLQFPDLADPSGANPNWTFASFTPDAVVIDLGAVTDLATVGTMGGTTEAAITTGLEAFMKQVYLQYNSTPYILVAIGPAYAGTDTPAMFGTAVANALTAFHTAYPAAKYGSVTATASQFSGGCYNSRPDHNSQASFATQVEGALHTALGW